MRLRGVRNKITHTPRTVNDVNVFYKAVNLRFFERLTIVVLLTNIFNSHGSVV